MKKGNFVVFYATRSTSKSCTLMTQRLHQFVLLLACLSSLSVAHAQQLLRIVTQANSTLTLAYLDQAPSTWQGHPVTSATPYHPTDYIYSTSDDEEYPIETIQRVVVDASVANYRPTSLKGLFAGMSELESIEGLAHLNTSAVTDMSALFTDCYALTSIDLSHFDTRQVKTMQAMFTNCSALTSLDLSTFDTQQVTDMASMFAGCSSLTHLHLSHFNTSAVRTMRSLFAGCSSLSELHVRGFDTRQVTTMREAFEDCHTLTSLDLSSWRTEAVTDMGSMFSYCEGLTTLDLSHFNTSEVTDLSRMFYGCTQLQTLDLSNFNTRKVVGFTRLFAECHNLRSLTLNSFDGSVIGQGPNAGERSATGVFEACKRLAYIDMSRAQHFSDTWLTHFLASAHPATLKYLPQGSALIGENLVSNDGHNFFATAYNIGEEDATFQGEVSIPHAFVADAINTRTLRPTDGATTWFAPYSVEVPEGFTAYTYTSADAQTSTATFTATTDPTLHAQKAYLLLPNDNTNSIAPKASQPMNVPSTSATAPAEVGGDYTFIGTFKRLTAEEATAMRLYDLHHNHMWQAYTNTTTAPRPMRAYLKPNTTEARTTNTLATTIHAPTNIQRILLQGGKAHGQTYDLNGRHLGTAPIALPHGLYIIDGQKVRL